MGNSAKIEKIMVYMKNKMLLGRADLANGKYLNYISLDEINGAIAELAKQKGVTLSYLVANGLVSCDPKILSKYDIDIFEGKIIDRTKPRVSTPRVRSTPIVEPSTPVSTPITPVEDAVSTMTPEPTVPVTPVVDPVPTEDIPVVEPVVTADVPVHSDGAVDPVITAATETTPVVAAAPVAETSPSKETKKRKRIKNLKTFGITTLALAGAIAVIAGGLNSAVKNNTGKDVTEGTKVVVNVDGTEYDARVYATQEPVVYQEDTIIVHEDDSYFMPEATPVPEYDEAYSFGSSISALEEDMASQAQAVNDICFRYERCTLEQLVTESDFDAIYTINSLRNDVVSNRCSGEVFMNNIVNYIFESGNNFNGRVIKTYDSLSPFAQYIVLVAGQSILVEKCPSYNHQTQYNNYDASNLSISFDYMVDATYRQITSRSKTM